MRRADGGSLIEALVALAVTATASAALLPVLAMAARLQRESEIETMAVVVAASELARVGAEVRTGARGVGGSLESDVSGWQWPADARGASSVDLALFDCRAEVRAVDGLPGVAAIAVRVRPRAGGTEVTLATVVPDG